MNNQLHKETEENIDFVELLRAKYIRARILLKSYWWIMLLAISAGIGLKGYLSSIKEPEYVSQAQIIINGKISLNGATVYNEYWTNFFETQMTLMQSNKIAMRAQARVEALHPDLEKCKVQLVVKQPQNIGIFFLSATGSNKQYTQAYLQAIMSEFLNFRKDMRSKTANRSFVAMTEEILDLENEIEESETEKSIFKRENNIVSIEEQGRLLQESLTDLKNSYNSFEMELKLLNQLTVDEYLESLDLEVNPNIATSSALTEEEQYANDELTLTQISQKYINIKKTINWLETDLKEFSMSLQPNHPKIVDINQEIQIKKSLLQTYYRQCMRALDERRSFLESKIKNLSIVLVDKENQALDFNNRLAEYDRIDSKIKRQQNVLSNLLNSLQSIDVNLNIEQEIFSILEDATPGFKVLDNQILNLSIGAFLGFVLGSAILVIIALFGAKIISEDDIAKNFEEPVLGMIPFEKSLEKVNPFLNKDSNSFTFTEACRNIRSSLFYFKNNAEEPQTIAVTSSAPSEGKSTVALSVAAAFSYTSKKVLLIDADLRRGELHRSFNLSNKVGLTEIITNDLGYNDVIQRTSLDNLDMISTGKSIDNPGELLIHPKMKRTLQELKQRYDVVIIDTAPLLAADDTSSFAKNVDSVLFVIRSNFVKLRQIRQSLALLSLRGISVFGFVLNRVNNNSILGDYYKYSDYYVHANTKVNKPKEIAAKVDKV